MGSIFRRFFTYILAIGFIPIFITILLILYFRILIQDEIVSNYQRLCDVFAISSYNAVENFSKRLDYLNYIHQVYKGERDFLKKILEKYPEVMMVSILDEEGLEVERLSRDNFGRFLPLINISKEKYFESIKDGGIIGDFKIVGGIPIGTIIYPLANRFVFVVVNLTSFFSNIYSTKIGLTGFVFFISDDGKILSDIKLNLDINNLISSNSGYFITRISGEKYLVVFRRIANFSLYVALAQSERESLRDINILFYGLLFVIFFVLTISYFVAYTSAKNISEPISALVEESKKISLRDFSGRIDIRSKFEEINKLISTFNMMVEELAKYQKIQIEEIMDEREKLSIIMQNMKSGIALLDLSGTPLYMNQSCVDIIGRRKAREFFHSLVNKKQLIQTNIFRCGEKYYEFYYDIIRLHKGNPLIFFTISDITAEMNIYKMKEDIYRSIVHDVRTPLINMQGYIKLLSYDIPERLRKYVVGLETESGVIFRMLENILDISRIENKSIVIEKNKIEMNDYLGKIAERFKISSEYKNISFQYKKFHNKIFCDIDEEFFRRAVENILTNAFKYTPSGGTVILGLEYIGDGWVKVFVKDTGKGISREKMKDIFDRFKTSSKDGFGLGLNIAKAIVELHGGRIEIDSEEGSGTEVRVFIKGFVENG